MWFKHSHTAVRLLLKAFVGRHAQGHLAYLAAETTFVPILEEAKIRDTCQIFRILFPFC